MRSHCPGNEKDNRIENEKTDLPTSEERSLFIVAFL
jgi:hypothetical protein